MLGALHFVKLSVFKFVALSEVSQKGIQIFPNSPPLQALFLENRTWFSCTFFKIRFLGYNKSYFLFFNTLPVLEHRQFCCEKLLVELGSFGHNFSCINKMNAAVWLEVLLKNSMIISGFGMFHSNTWFTSQVIHEEWCFTIKSGNLYNTGPAIVYFPCDIRYWKAHQLM